MSISGKVALVTGGANGVGLQFVKALVANGARHVSVLDDDEQEGRKVVSEINDKCGSRVVSFYKYDVTNKQELEGTFSEISVKHNALDIVINGAGIMKNQWREEDDDLTVEVFTNTVLLGFERMGKNRGGNGGTILNIFGVYERQDPPVLYSINQAVIDITDYYGDFQHFEESGVRVMAVCPGVTEFMVSEGSKITEWKKISMVQGQRHEDIDNGVVHIFQHGQTGSVWTIEEYGSLYEVCKPPRQDFETTNFPTNIPFKIELGAATNLVKGYASGWDPTNGNLDILNRPTSQPIVPQTFQLPKVHSNWGYPAISLHETVESLLTDLFEYTVDESPNDPAPPLLPTGALLVSSPTGAKARKSLGETLGVSLDDNNLRYALVKVIRLDETIFHVTKKTGSLITVDPLRPNPQIEISKNFKQSMAHLRRIPDTATGLTQEEANNYLAHFAQYGTHFVSSISIGDKIVQVFAYDATRFERVKEGFKQNDFSGLNSVDFTNYTTDATTGRFGYVRQYGKILCFSNSKVFEETLKNGGWFENFWAKHNSIFQIFAENATVSRAWLNKYLTEQAPIGLTLAPLTTIMRRSHAEIWRRMFKAAMSAVFRDAINPNFIPRDSTDFSTMILEDQPDVISMIATPNINVYKARLSLSGMQLIMKSEVRTSVFYGYVVAGTSQNVVDLPGSQVRLFGYILDMRATGQPNIISLSADGFAGLILGCDRFLGEARFQSSGGNENFLIADGLRYDLDENGWPSVTSDVRQPPPASCLPSLKDNLEFSLAFGETVLGIQIGGKSDNPTQQLARGYLKWVGKVIPADFKDKDLSVLRFRSLDLSKYTPNSGYGAFVPILPANEYEKSTQKIMEYLQEIRRQIGENQILIQQRKQEESILNSVDKLNENIVKTGELLTGLIKANAQTVKDLSDHYDSVITASEKEASERQKKINSLSKSVHEQQAEVNQAVQNYKDAVKDWITMETIKFGLDVATNVFSLGVNIAVPSSSISAVKELWVCVQKLQKILNVLNATMKVYTTFSGPLKDIQKAQKVLEDLDDMNYGDISALNWDELILNLDVVMATGPKGNMVDEAKARLVAAFKILSARGKALANAQSNLLQIQRDIYATQCQKVLNKREGERLNKLTEALHPVKIEKLDKQAIDLVGLTRSLDYLNQQMLSTLVKSFLLQDQALQYKWLQKPTPISSYSILTFMHSRIEQSQATEEAKSQLLRYQTSVTKPLIYEINGVLPESLSDGNAYDIIIDPNHDIFMEYVNLRVESVVAEVTGIKSTNSGKLNVKLTFEDKPFIDRNIMRESIRFHTLSRERVYQFDVAKGTPNFTDEGKSWSENVSRVTPFGTWSVSLPKTQINSDLTFSDGVTVGIRLTFVLEARIVDASIIGSPSYSGTPVPDYPVLHAEEFHSRIMDQRGVRGSREMLIDNLYIGQNVTNSWDVVFNMEMESINRALQMQYDDLKENTTYKNTVEVCTEDKAMKNMTVIKKFYLEYGYPLLNFQANNPNTVKLEMPIIKGTLTKCGKYKDNPVECDEQSNIEGKTFTAFVPLTQVSGKTTDDHNVLYVKLNMEMGAFSINDIEISDEEKVALNRAIKAYFVTHKVEYLINGLDLTENPGIKELIPSGFRFKVLLTPAGVRILQLFIQTGGRELLDESQTNLNGISEPLPEGSETSLLISDKLFFCNILPKVLQKSSGWTMKGETYTYLKREKFRGVFTQSYVSSADIDLSEFTQSNPGGKYGGGSETVYSLPGKKIDCDLSGMTMKPLKNAQIELNSSKSLPVEIQAQRVESNIAGKSPPIDYTISTSLKVDLNGIIMVNVEGSGRNQDIVFTVGGNSVTVTGHMSGGGLCGMDDVQAKVNKVIKKTLPPKVMAKLNDMKFSSISLFALKNLLFPKNDYIEFGNVAVPGDMVVLGKFKNLDK